MDDEDRPPRALGLSSPGFGGSEGSRTEGGDRHVVHHKSTSLKQLQAQLAQMPALRPETLLPLAIAGGALGSAALISPLPAPPKFNINIRIGGQLINAGVVESLREAKDLEDMVGGP